MCVPLSSTQCGVATLIMCLAFMLVLQVKGLFDEMTNANLR